jgi:arylsulfatase A-like enzyme
VKVDAFIYSEMIPDNARGTEYPGLFHVSDWFPTILELADIEYSPTTTDHTLDGVSQAQAMFGLSTVPRDHILYNLYYNVEKKPFYLNRNSAFGVRKNNLKLLHSFEDTDQAMWYDFSEALDDDSVMDSGSCPQMLALRGNYNKFIFDLDADPYETTNLYSDDRFTTQKVKNYVYFSINLNDFI